jgi:hypothetical protein
MTFTNSAARLDARQLNLPPRRRYQRGLKELTDLARHPAARQPRELRRFIEADTAFHCWRAIVLVKAVSEARSQMERIMLAAIDSTILAKSRREHLAILTAIRNGILRAEANMLTTLCIERRSWVLRSAPSLGRTCNFTSREALDIQSWISTRLFDIPFEYH